LADLVQAEWAWQQLYNTLSLEQRQRAHQVAQFLA